MALLGQKTRAIDMLEIVSSSRRGLSSLLISQLTTVPPDLSSAS
jgi:hypothetical protein